MAAVRVAMYYQPAAGVAADAAAAASREAAYQALVEECKEKGIDIRDVPPKELQMRVGHPRTALRRRQSLDRGGLEPGLSFAKHMMELRDARGAAVEQGLLSGSGFELFRHSSRVRDWHDERQLEATYYGEIEALMARAFPSAVRVGVVGHILRDEKPFVRDVSTEGARLERGTAGALQGPARFVHNDYIDSFREHCAALADGDITYKESGAEAVIKPRCFTSAELRSHRVVMVNLWRSITPHPLARMPLAVCDRRSVARADLHPRPGSDSAGEWAEGDPPPYDYFSASHNPAHRWYYFKGLRQDEVMGFVTYDSHPDGEFTPTLHSAVQLPGTQGMPRRESCEVRACCLLPLPAGAAGAPPPRPKL